MSLKSLLLVEDNAGDARLLREMFKEQGRFGIELAHVECMCEAEKYLAERDVDLILLDLGLPDVQGLAAVRRLHAVAPRIPLVVLTGLDDESLAVSALQEGAQDYLIKGQIEVRGLVRALRYAVERKIMEERHRNLMEHANDAILLLQPSLWILEANRRAEELFGCPRDQIAGCSYESFVAPEDRGLLASGRATLLTSGASEVQDLRLLRADGSVVCVDISSSLIRIGEEPVVLSILHDISERKRAASELVAAKNSLHHLLSENPAVIYALRIEAAALPLGWISQNVDRLLGYSVEEALAPEWWSDCLHPEERERVQAELAELYTHNRLIQEYRFRHKDGTYLWLRDEKRVLLDADGAAAEVVGSWSDITARKAVERRLLESEQEYHLLFDSNPHAMFVFDDETLGFLAVNAAAIQLYGYSKQEFLGMTIKDLRPAEDDPAFVEYLATLSDGLPGVSTAIGLPGVPTAIGRSVMPEHLRHRKKDGSLIEVDAGSNPIEFRGRRARLVLANDVTARRRTEAKFRGLLEAAPDAMVIVGHDGRIVLINSRAETLFGYSREELLGRPVEDLVPDSALAAYFADPRPRPMGSSLALTGRRRDGSEFPVEISLSPVETEDGTLVTAAIRDVSEKKLLEAQLVQAQKMEAVGRLAGGVAHDFNNLLGVITGYSELLLKNLGPTHPGSRRVEEIQKAADRAAGLTRQLLAFSRKQVLQPRVLDLNEVLADVETMLRRVIGEDIQLVTTTGRDLDCIKADPGQLEQVLMNLVVNARDAMPKGGGLAFETANVVLDEAYTRAHPEVQPGPFVMLSICDTGEGMSAETQAHIFEPFFTTKEEGKGTGLGLATVFGIVQQSNGSISVESQQGMGTLFKIYFPKVDEEVTRPSEEAAAKAPRSRGAETILLVEDADSLRVMIREVLETAGYTVVEFSDPEEALLSVGPTEAPVRLMLTDVVMPGISGPDLAQRMRVERPEIKVLFMSGYTDEAAGLQGMLSAGAQFIQKPFAADVLLRKVRETIDAA